MTIDNVTAGVVVDPDWGNAVADKLNTFDDAVQTYTPVLRSSGTQPNLGADGSAGAWWYLTGPVCHMWQFYRFEGTGLTGGTGTYNVDLPSGIKALTGFRVSVFTHNGMAVGSGGFRDDSAPTTTSQNLVVGFRDSSTLQLVYANGGAFGQGNPVNMATGDVISLSVSFPWEYI